MTTNKEQSFIKRLMKSLTKANELGQEDKVMTDHDYDGIRELNNVLPPWWLYGFYITIIIGIFYYVQVFTNSEEYSQDKEFVNDVEQANKDIEAYKTAHPELFKTDVVLFTDAENLAAGKTIFEATCLACHMADGGGGIGPNLTDDHWILGGGIEKIYHTISEGGRPGKGMIPWKGSFKPMQIQQVASYVISLQGTTPANPKASEGDIVWTKQ
ncbi:MAG: c-type cytochrome [Flavobacteriales bacterium]|jgi:cytochrome c oxidase cbb3-type subunit III|nr:c-type cytochrome [Flavobacteriales bacterium]